MFLSPSRDSSLAPLRKWRLLSRLDCCSRVIQQVPGTFRQANGLCYGQKTVDAIVKWTEPVAAGESSQTEVTYTYKIVNLAGWAERPDVQRAFPIIHATLTGASKTTEIAGLQLTNKGWKVPGS